MPQTTLIVFQTQYFSCYYKRRTNSILFRRVIYIAWSTNCLKIQSIRIQMGLPSGKCFEFRLAVYAKGRWSKFSKSLRVSTTLRKWNGGTGKQPSVTLASPSLCLIARLYLTQGLIPCQLTRVVYHYVR